MNRYRYVGRRLAFIPVGAFLVFTLSFFLVNVIPSDPVQELVGPTASAEAVAQVTHELGLDRSIWSRYLSSLHALFTDFSLGQSYFTKRDVWSDIGKYLPATLELVVLSLAVATLLGVGLGALGAYLRGRRADRLTQSLVTLLQVIPDFLLGLILIFVLFYKLGWVPPATGQLGLIDQAPPHTTGAYLIDALIAGEWDTAGAAAQHAILPVLTLGISSSALFAKITRTALSGALRSHQVEFARACGLSPWRVFGYAFSAARTQIVTYAGLLFAGLIGGDVIVEQLFSWNGIGQFAAERINQLDLPEIQGIILVLAMITLGVLLIIDIAVALLDPRVSYE